MMRDIDYRRKSHAHKAKTDYDRKEERKVIVEELSMTEYQHVSPEDIIIEHWDSNELYHGNFGFHSPRGVKVTHIPTGIVVTEDNCRSQYRNKHLALMNLSDMLEEIKNGGSRDEPNKRTN